MFLQRTVYSTVNSKNNLNLLFEKMLFHFFPLHTYFFHDGIVTFMLSVFFLINGVNAIYTYSRYSQMNGHVGKQVSCIYSAQRQIDVLRSVSLA